MKKFALLGVVVLVALISAWNFVQVSAQIKPRELKLLLQETGLKAGSPVFIRIFKEESQLEVWLEDGDSYKLLHTYPVCYWSGTLGPKLKEGDRQSPEGFYAVSAKQLNPNSTYHLSFNLGFPNLFDRAHKRTGSFLMVHGDCVSIGCYAMGDEQIEQIYGLIESSLNAGQKSVPVHVFPFRMTQERMNKAADNPWIDYWRNLKIGHDLFEAENMVPDVSVCGDAYAFGVATGCKPIQPW